MRSLLSLKYLKRLATNETYFTHIKIRAPAPYFYWLRGGVHLVARHFSHLSQGISIREARATSSVLRNGVVRCTSGYRFYALLGL